MVVSEEEDDKADALPAAGPAVVQEGELYMLGEHVIFCGSALERESYRLLMGARHADLVFTDPPYNVPIQGHVSGLGKVKHRGFSQDVGDIANPSSLPFSSAQWAMLRTGRGTARSTSGRWIGGISMN